MRYKGLTELRAAQDETVAQLVGLAGEGGVVRTKDMTAVMRGCDAEGLARVRQIMEMVTDSVERASVLARLQNGRIDVRSAEGFAAWQEQRAARLQERAGQEQAAQLTRARKAVEANIAPAAATQPAAEQSQQMLAANETAARPETTTVTNDERTAVGILNRVPHVVINETLSEIARERSRESSRPVDSAALYRTYAEQMRSGSLNVDLADLRAFNELARTTVGFADAGPALWANRSSRSQEGRIAANARGAVKSILSRILANNQ